MVPPYSVCLGGIRSQDDFDLKISPQRFSAVAYDLELDLLTLIERGDRQLVPQICRISVTHPLVDVTEFFIAPVTGMHRVGGYLAYPFGSFEDRDCEVVSDQRLWIHSTARRRAVSQSTPSRPVGRDFVSNVRIVLRRPWPPPPLSWRPVCYPFLFRCDVPNVTPCLEAC
jgi:hypothetical protein